MSVLGELDQIRFFLTGAGQPFELVDADVAGQTIKVYRHLPPNLSHLIVAAHAFGARDFLVDGDRRISYAEALEQAAGLAEILRTRYGAGADVRVAIAMRNAPEWVIAFLAIELAGATASLVNSRGTAEDMIYALHETECSVLIADSRRAQMIGDAFGGDVIVRAESGGFLDAAGAPLEIAPTRPVLSDALPDDPAVIMFTSGTTGRPKGAVLTHRGQGTFLMGIRHNGAVYLSHMAKKLGMEPMKLAAAMPQPATLAIFPLFHISGASAMLMGAVQSGGKIVFMTRWDPAEALRLIERERITMLQGPPAAFWDILRCPALATARLDSVTNLGIGGQATPPNLLDELLKVFPKAQPGGGYGQTESNGSISSATGEEYRACPSGSGRVLPGIEVRIADDDGNELPPGTVGEIWSRGALTMAGYWNRPEADAAAFRDGWLRMGDMGFVDENRFVIVVDRKKDVVIRGGENIYCAELERVFADCPGVMEVAAFGVPDERLGERVVLAAVAHHGHALDADSILNFGRARLADYKVPSEIVFAPAPFARNAVGKVDKVALRAAYSDQRN